MKRRDRRERFSAAAWIGLIAAPLATALLCVLAGSVAVPLGETLDVIRCLIGGLPLPEGIGASIIPIRLPRVLCVALTGASLSLCGAAMQGLLRNPLADGSTLGVSAGASLGAVLSLAFGVTIPGLPMAGTMAMAMLFAFGSLMLILSLAYLLDRSLATHSIILIGVIFSMFASSLMSLVISFSGDRIRSITFWTMGSLANKGYTEVLILLGALLPIGFILLRLAPELNSFAVGEENARGLGVPVRPVKLTVLICVSALIGVCVSIGGTIAFVGLVTPHMARLLVGPNHRRLLPASLSLGVVFLLLSDLAARTLLNPRELNLGVVTSLVGAVAFVILFYRTGRRPTR